MNEPTPAGGLTTAGGIEEGFEIENALGTCRLARRFKIGGRFMQNQANKAHSARFSPRHGARSLARRGFTLVEILIVVVILGILAAVVVPQFSNATYQARENTLKDDLRYLRTQVMVYRAQHRDVAPGAGSADFMDQMTLYTDESGNTNATKTGTFRFGPYLSRMPANPLASTEKTDVLISNATDLSTVIDDSNAAGWIYNPATLQIIANQSGSDTNGTLYSTY